VHVGAQTLVAVLLALAIVQPASSDWHEYLEDPQDKDAVVEDNPVWNKYAFDLPYVDGDERLTFKDLARSDKPFILFFWLTDCPLCHLQMPYIQQMQKQVEEYELNLQIVSICLDPDDRYCLPYIEEKGISFDVLLDARGRRTDRLYEISEIGTPVIFVFKNRGEFVEYYTGFRSGIGKTILELLEIELPADEPRTK
jgi:thiol-disulfide isomerase/thioredoxin